MKYIFEPLKLRNLKLKNRLVRSATWEGIANEDGGINKKAYQIYDELAKGGVGAIITGFTSVSSNDFYFDGMMRLSDDHLIDPYKKLTAIIHAQKVPVLTQLALGAYYRPLTSNRFQQVEPDDLSIEEIHWIRNQFIQASIRAKKAGFDGVQIHVAHFFFLSRFVSPACNHRTDMYGGSTENRTRLIIEIIKGIQDAVPELHISAKINSSDFTNKGLDEQESLAMCKLLAAAGIDSIEVSGNGTSVSNIIPLKNEAYFAPFAIKLAKEIDTPILLVGGLRSLATINTLLQQTEIEMFSISRPLLREPDLPNKWKSGMQSVSKCISCNACYTSPNHKCIF